MASDLTSRGRAPAERVRLGGWFLGLSAAFLAATSWAVYDELVTRRPWKAIRADFNRLALHEGFGASDEGQDGKGPRGSMGPISIGIEQIVLPELGVVDRCPTCHVAIDRPGFDGPEVPEPFRTHPRREILLRHHPPNEVGCTPCHDGQGPQTKGVGGRPFAHGLEDPFWERPLLEGPLVESSCYACHASQAPLPEARTLARGRALYEALRCYGCHTSRHFASDAPAGPPLGWTRQKIEPAFLEAWIRAPHEIRPHTRMPDHWPRPVALDGSPLPVNGAYPASDPSEPPQEVEAALAAWERARAREPRAIAAFLYSLELSEQLEPPPAGGDVARGRRLYTELGCRGCHEPAEEGQRPFGPELDRTGEKASRAWLWAWLGGPKALWRDARMPDLRLTDEERRDLVAYLESLRERDREPPGDMAGLEDPALVAEGRRLATDLGCYGCHEIPGFEHLGKAGPELEGLGDRTPDLLEWGDTVAPRGRPLLQTWTRWKIAQPRRMTRPGIVLAMPQNQLDEADVEALTAFVLADRDRDIPEAFRAPSEPEARPLHAGEALVERLGCRICHEIGREIRPILDEDGEVLYVEHTPQGGALRKFYDSPSDAPPPLTFGGLKLRYDWLYAYLEDPTRIGGRAPSTGREGASLRPWLPGRMPTFDLSPDELETLVAYFAARDDEPYPFRPLAPRPLPEADLEDAIWLFAEMQCLKCHQLSTLQGDTSELAPDLALAASRLNPEWVRQLILDPQRLQPGTRMPTLFPLEDDDVPGSYMTPYPERLGGDVHRQVRALVALTFRFGEDTEVAEKIRRASARRGSTLR